MKPKSVRLYFNRQLVATDIPSSINKGRLSGEYTDANGVDRAISATVNYLEGKIEGFTLVGVAAGIDTDIEFDVFIENAPGLIPKINHEMRSWVVRPHESIIAADHTVQAYWSLQREYGVDLRSMQMNHQRNWLAYEKDRRHLRDMIYGHQGAAWFNTSVTGSQYFKEKWERLNQLLTILSQKMLSRTMTSGLVGIFAGAAASAVFKSLGAPFFVPVANYRQVNRIHFVGTLFGKWKLFECPKAIATTGQQIGPNDCLLYGRGENHTEAGYVAGDAVPATMYQHGITRDMYDRNTLWELAYGDIHPNEGGKYFLKLTLSTEKAGEVPAWVKNPTANSIFQTDALLGGLEV